jgi:hypothetical protein
MNHEVIMDCIGGCVFLYRCYLKKIKSIVEEENITKLIKQVHNFTPNTIHQNLTYNYWFIFFNATSHTPDYLRLGSFCINFYVINTLLVR